MKKIIFVVFISVLTFSYQNCSRSSFETPQITVADPGNNNSSSTTNPTNTHYEKMLNVLHYYKGGWMPAPGSANYSHDAIFTFINNSAAYVQYKQLDSSNCLGDKTLSKAQISDILNKVNNATKLMTRSEGPTRADGGVEYADMSFSDASKLMAYIDGAEAPKESLLIVNPDAGKALSDYLKAIVDSSEDLSQSSCVGAAADFKSLKYVKREDTTWTEGNNKFKGVRDTKNRTFDFATKKITFGDSDLLSNGACSADLDLADFNTINNELEDLSVNKQGNNTSIVSNGIMEYVELTYKDGSVKKIHLSSSNAAPAANLATSELLSSTLSKNPSNIACIK